ncbi:MAG TPA: carboxymuconolactone decarboxylase family protein [Stellaceae bacterium]|nr:carboxymuconolactone decarboxylase family protein [Stellaceae bacterium]
MAQPNYRELAADAYRALGAVHKLMRGSSIEATLVDLIYLRVSQLNGCAYCVDLHTHDLLAAGEKPQKLYNMTVWYEAPFFSPRERAALAWAEALTRLPIEHPSAALHEETRRAFTDKEFADLTFVIATMNAYNRLGVGFEMRPSLRN